jgi:hypothetical protein
MQTKSGSRAVVEAWLYTRFTLKAIVAFIKITDYAIFVDKFLLT